MEIYRGDKFLAKDNGCVYEVLTTCQHPKETGTIIVFGRSPFNFNALTYYMKINEFLECHDFLGNIKPCPFCGGKAKIIEIDVESFDVKCEDVNCYLEGGADWTFDTRQEAIDKWNKRGFNNN